MYIVIEISVLHIPEQKALIEKQQEKEKKRLEDFREMVITAAEVTTQKNCLDLAASDHK